MVRNINGEIWHKEEKRIAQLTRWYEEINISLHSIKRCLEQSRKSEATTIYGIIQDHLINNMECAEVMEKYSVSKSTLRRRLDEGISMFEEFVFTSEEDLTIYVTNDLF